MNSKLRQYLLEWLTNVQLMTNFVNQLLVMRIFMSYITSHHMHRNNIQTSDKELLHQ